MPRGGEILVTKTPKPGIAIVGVAEHSNTAVLVTLTRGRDLLDRRSIELTPPGCPTHPHHHEGSWAVGRYLSTPGARPITLEAAVAIVEQVRKAAERGAHDGLETLAASVSMPIAGIALRACPPLPPTVEARIADNRVQTIADGVMYREALARAAAERGWAVHWYVRERVFSEAATVLDSGDLEAFLTLLGKKVGAPWQANHKLAAAAAIWAAKRYAPNHDDDTPSHRHR